MSLARRVLLAGVPDPQAARPHHGCAAGMWVWACFALALSVVGLVVGACCASL